MVRTDMKIIHGDGLKQIIRFDDDNRSLYIDVKLPKDDCWHRVDDEIAADFKKRRDQLSRQRTTGIHQEAYTKNDCETKPGNNASTERSDWTGQALSLIHI